MQDGLRITYFWIKEQIEKEKAKGMDLSVYGSSKVVGTQAPVQLGSLRAADGKEWRWLQVILSMAPYFVAVEYMGTANLLDHELLYEEDVFICIRVHILEFSCFWNNGPLFYGSKLFWSGKLSPPCCAPMYSESFLTSRILDQTSMRVCLQKALCFSNVN